MIKQPVSVFFKKKKEEETVSSLWCAPVSFSSGDYYSGPPGDLDQEPDDDWVKSRQNEGRAYQEWDEDADVDESGEVWFSASFHHCGEE